MGLCCFKFATCFSSSQSKFGADRREVALSTSTTNHSGTSGSFHGGDQFRDEEVSRLLVLLMSNVDLGNTVCADCDTAKPEWASLTHKVFICIQCSGVHRSLGTDVSRVVSTKLDIWTMEMVQEVKSAGGNYNVNVALEAKLKKVMNKPNPSSKNAERFEWIYRKYAGMEYVEFYKLSKAELPAAYTSLLKITVIGAESLVVGDFLTRLADPYVRCNLGDQVQQTTIKPNTLQPRWNEVLMLAVPSGESCLEVSVLDYDALQEDNDLGKVTLHFSSENVGTRRGSTLALVCDHNAHKHLFHGGTRSKNFKFVLQGVPRGKIALNLEWIPS